MAALHCSESKLLRRIPTTSPSSRLYFRPLTCTFVFCTVLKFSIFNAYHYSRTDTYVDYNKIWILRSICVTNVTTLYLLKVTQNTKYKIFSKQMFPSLHLLAPHPSWRMLYAVLNLKGPRGRGWRLLYLGSVPKDGWMHEGAWWS